MKPSSFKLTILCLLTLVYNYVFWQEKLGINLLLFSTLLIASLFYFYPQSWKATNVRISTLFTILSLIMVVWHNSLTSKLAHITSFLIMAGFIHVREYRTVYNALASYVFNFFAVIPNFISEWKYWSEQSKLSSTKTGKSLYQLRFSLIPLVFFSIFFSIFKIANPVFSDLSDSFFNSIATFFDQLFANISFVRILFIVSGLYLIGSFLYYMYYPQLLASEQKHTNIITRQRRFVKSQHINFSLVGLKNEYTTALILIISVNVLLLIVNIIDIRWLWFNFDYSTAGNLAKLVHEGTYMLILSILLSMGILLFYFRRSLNFYKNNKLLLQSSYLWIIQNCILGFSVLLRCYHYIHEYGLAYKRIGVVVFLILTYVGLFTLYQKISQKKSFFYLLRINSWAAYGMFILLTLVNWDVFIVSYNLQHPNVKMGIDLEFLLSRSDKTLPLLDQYKNRISKELESQRMDDKSYRFDNSTKKQYLEDRIQHFITEYPTYSWLSWNYTDYQAYQYFKTTQK
ncbi:DUF4173 domain-containing protein [Xanthocytophaga agilis]|uniref:DUF4173 domain-containing protein n=1 Tax=Xanthocytophaga agilis TaxID=3048010 RepID=A0AAE3R6W1_9BACT|nr:DUF4173 domain-containing protein [Xanthocytophaga agilis]MDJ1501893.1 DUF4173 domain-containing protein [Xanthocytophaga agilis]